MDDPMVPDNIRQRVRAGMGRYYRRKKAAQRALMQQWAKQHVDHEHTPTTVSAPVNNGQRGRVLDEIEETRCTSCRAFLGFPA